MSSKRFLVILIALVACAVVMPGAAMANPGPVAVNDTVSQSLSQFALTSVLAAGDSFGYSIAVSGDTAVVGARQTWFMGDTGPGAAYVFRLIAGVWTQEATLTAGLGNLGDRFGSAVAIDGTTILVGAPYNDANSVADAGAAYVFQRSGSLWSQTATLTASNGSISDRFGSSVSISGSTAAIGAFGVGTPSEPAGQSGAAYVFTKSAVWAETKIVTDTVGVAGDRFGRAIAVSGGTLMIGAPGPDETPSTPTGKVCVFTGSGASWTQGSNLSTVGVDPGDRFGAMLQSTSTNAVVGAWGPFSPQETPTLYTYTGSGATWSRTATTTASDGPMNAFLGSSMSLSGGSTFVGFDYRPGLDFKGEAWVYGPKVPLKTPQGTALSVSAPGVLVNDYDGGGLPLIATRVAAPGHGIVALEPNGGFIYIPTPGFSGTDTFTYNVSNGSADSDVATVTITVLPDCTVTYVPGAGGTITAGTNPQTVVSGGTATPVTAAPSTGYDFVNWTGTGGFVPTTTNPVTVTNVTADTTLTANFVKKSYSIVPAPSTNGTISPDTTQTVEYGADKTFTFTPASGYRVATLTVDASAAATTAASYTFKSVTTTHTIGVTFAKSTYTIVPAPSTNGTISPDTTQTVEYGADKTFTFTPAPGYHVATLTVDASAVATTAASYTFKSVAATHTIGVTFAKSTYTIVPAPSINGTITPNTTQTVDWGADKTFTFTPAPGYHVATLTVDASAVATDATSYTFKSVTATHTIGVTFAVDPTPIYTLTYIAAPGGSIVGSATQSITSGGSGTEVTATPAAHYTFVKWSDNDSTASARRDTTVTANLTTTAFFAIDTFRIVPSRSANGTISPDTTQTVDYGGSRTFTFTPAPNYHVSALSIDGSASVETTAASYTFTNVTESHTIHVTFAPDASGMRTVWRFRSKTMLGSYLWTIDPNEMATVKANTSGPWIYEGPAFSINENNPLNNNTMIRFRNLRDNSYFWTADPVEINNLTVNLTSTWLREGPAWNVSLAEVGLPVWRFRCLKNSTHLWTMDPNEKLTIDRDMKDIYELEGIAYHLGQ